MISREEAIQKLKEYWGVDKFVFQAEFHIPQNINLREGSKPFGYFRNLRLNSEIIDYPLVNVAKHEKKISLFQILKNNLEDKNNYQVEVELAKDEFRVKNPYALIVKNYKKNNEIDFNDIGNAIDKIIREICHEKLNQNSPYTMVELANSVESLATDIYSENKRFIYELIQNADDAALDSNSALEIRLTKNYVILSHQGKPFDSRDIRGLCSIGIGTKRNDDTKTGYKGIGFKSVFGQPEGIVYVKTENTLFRFDKEFSKDKGWNPKWGNKENWEVDNGIKFSCPWQMIPIISSSSNDIETDSVLNNPNFMVKTAIKISNSDSLCLDILELFKDARFLLFLRRIKSVSFVSEENSIVLSKKVDHENQIVTLLKNEAVISNWYLKNWIHKIPIEIQEDLKKDPKTPQKIQEMEKTELSFAFQLNEKTTEIKLLNKIESPLYSYLPTTVTEYNLPFIVNCNFLIDASREKIHKDRIWNEWLFKVIGLKTIECCAVFAQEQLFSKSYLSILKNGYFETLDNLRINYNAGIKIGLEREAFIFNRNDNLCKINEVYLDSFGLIDNKIATSSSLSNYINQNLINKYSDDNILSIDEEIVFLKKYKVSEFSEKQLQEFITSSLFTDQINLENNKSILKFLMDLDKTDPSKEWYSIITNNSYIINENETIDKIIGVCFPINVPLENIEFNNSLIHPRLYNEIIQDTKLLEWLIELGVTEPGSIAYLEKEIIAKIDQCITQVNYIKVTEFLLCLHLSKRLEIEHYIALQNLPLKTQKGFISANNCILSITYNPIIDLASILNDCNVVSDDYINKYNATDWRHFLKKIQVSDDIEFISNYTKKASTFDVNYINLTNEFAKDQHTYPHLIGKFKPNPPTYEVTYFIQYFSFFDKIINSQFAQIFWDRVLSKYHLTFVKKHNLSRNYCPEKEEIIYNLSESIAITSIDKMNWGYMNSNRAYVPSYIFWMFQNKSCIPTNQGNKLAKEVFINTPKIIELVGNYYPIIKVEKEVTKGWNQVLHLKTKLDYLDLLNLLSKISNDCYKDGNIKKDNEKRIGLIYNELITILQTSNELIENKIKEWASVNKLISSNLKSISPIDLLWIKIAGFNDVEHSINTLLLPKNVDINNQYFEKLVELFGVKTIDDFEYEAINKIESLNFKIKILELLPFIGLLLKSKLKITNINSYFEDILIKLEDFKFFNCDSLRLVFLHEGIEIKGAPIDCHYDEKELLITKNWNNPLVAYTISVPLSKILKARYLDKEILFMLTLSNHQLLEYFESLNLSLNEILSLEMYSKIIDKINDIKDIQKSKRIEISSIEKISEIVEVQEKVSKNMEEIEETIAIIAEEENEIKFSKIEIEELEALLKRSLSNDEINDIWIIAAFRALKHYENNGYDVECSKNDFDNVIKKRYLENVTKHDGQNINILVRSAKYKLLRLTYNAWTDLGDSKFELFVVNGNNPEDYNIYKTQEEIVALNADSWIVRLDGENKVSNIDVLFNGYEYNSEIKFESIEILIRLPGNTNYNSIFSKFNDNKGSLEDF